jgi:hypothetical protein
VLSYYHRVIGQINHLGSGVYHLGCLDPEWHFLALLPVVRAGYQHNSTDTDADLVDRWFADVCKNVVAENFEQWEANQPFDARPRNIERRDIGDGRTEVS